MAFCQVESCEFSELGHNIKYNYLKVKTHMTKFFLFNDLCLVAKKIHCKKLMKRKPLLGFY
jgi:hypothetical protein